MSRTIVVGGGPVGVVAAMALARRGHDVLLVDRDPGPAADGSWPRRMGVMQFMHPHGFRPQTYQALQSLLPDVLEQLIDAGAEPRQVIDAPPGVTLLACRRLVFERVLRAALAREPGVTLHVGHADRILVDGGRVSGVQVDGAPVDADLVVSVTGRASPLGHELRAQPEGGNCGFAYVSRMYRTRSGEPLTDFEGGPRFQFADGYYCGVVPQDAGTLSTMIVRPTGDPALVGTRANPGYDAAAAAVPLLAEWTQPERFEPLTDALVGGGLTNTYFPQGPEPGVPPAIGLFFLGDAVCTTNPAAGRGISLGLMGVQHLLGLLDDDTLGLDDASRALDAWCEVTLRPWFDDHVHWDASLLARYGGVDIDPEAQRLPSDVICAAGLDDPEMKPAVAMYLGMVGGPDVLRGIEDRARARLRTGWRPPLTGPSAPELADVVNRAVAADVPAEPAPALTPAR